MTKTKENYRELFPDIRDSSLDNLRQAQMVMLRIAKIVDHICRKHDIDYWLCCGTLIGAARHKGFIPWDDDIDIGMMRADYDKFIDVCKYELPDELFLQTRQTDEAFRSLIVPLRIRDKNSLVVDTGETKNEPYHQGLFVDIFAFDFLPQNRLKRVIYKKLGRNINRFLRYKLGYDKKIFKYLLFKVLDRFVSVENLSSIQDILIKRVNKNNDKLIGFGIDSSLTFVYGIDMFLPLKDMEFEGHTFKAPKCYDSYLKARYGDYMQLPPKEEQKPNHSIDINVSLDKNIV